jgi:hypothetical protein
LRETNPFKNNGSSGKLVVLPLFNCGIVVGLLPKASRKGIRKALCGERDFGEFGNGFLDLNGVHESGNSGVSVRL